MVNDTYDLIIRESQNKDEKLAIIRVHLIQCKSKTRKKDLAGADWLIDYGLVLMSDHTYYCLGNSDTTSFFFLVIYFDLFGSASGE